MKQIKFIAVSILFASILCIGCKNSDDAKVSSSEKIEMTAAEKETAKTEISNTNTQIVSNLNALDVEASMQGYSKNLKSVSVTGATLTYQELEDGNKAAFAGLKSFNLTKVSEDFLFISETFVLCTWTGTLEVELKTGERFKNDIHTASLLYNKIDNEWKIVYEHGSETPGKLIAEE